MGTIQIRKGKRGEKYRASVRLEGFPGEYKTCETYAEAEVWIAEREAHLLAVRNGRTIKETFGYLHVKSGKPHAILLRKYQAEAIRSVHRSLAANHEASPLVCLPTGSGKTLVISGFIESILQVQPEARFLVVTHTQELVAQDFKKFNEYASVDLVQVGVASAGMGRVEMGKQVTFGTIQTLASRNYAQQVDYILIDEAHMLPPHDESLYRRTLNKVKAHKNVRVIGFTATPYRLDSGLLTDGPGAIFSEICYEADILELIRDKYLSPLLSTGSLVHADDAKLFLKGNDFEEASSSAEMKSLTPSILNELKSYGRNRKAWLVFCVTIDHAEQVAHALSTIGISAAVISSEIPNEERATRIANFNEGKLRALVNVNVLTTGFDAPQIDLIVSLRPTISTSLWVQICGRGMRIHPGKTNCLVLDYANNIAKHGPIDEIRIGGDTVGRGTAFFWDFHAAKPCPKCNTLCGARTLVCPNCGTPIHEGRGIELQATASTLPVLNLNVPDENNQKRCVDLRDLLSFYVIEDIADTLRERSSDQHVFFEFMKYSRTYQSLVNDCWMNGVLYEVEVGYSIEDLSHALGKDSTEIEMKIKNGTFPKPRLKLSDGSTGYSLLQVAVIMSGDGALLLNGDNTFLWYQHLIRIMELELASNDALPGSFWHGED